MKEVHVNDVPPLFDIVASELVSNVIGLIISKGIRIQSYKALRFDALGPVLIALSFAYLSGNIAIMTARSGVQP